MAEVITPNFRKYCSVISGLLLAGRPFAKALKLVDALTIVMDPNLEEETGSLLTQILISLKASQSHA
jgi:hypothetical protein